jgi:NAD(P)-dependent dehydrogenase (short-subunit alcohol dehydrogenase family)
MNCQDSHKNASGKQTVIGLATRGAKVYMGARSKGKALAAIHEIQEKHSSADIHFLELDLSSFQSVIAAANRLRAEEPALHGLINNAGIMGVPYSLTTDGYESQFQVGLHPSTSSLKKQEQRELTQRRPTTCRIGCSRIIFFLFFSPPPSQAPRELSAWSTLRRTATRRSHRQAESGSTTRGWRRSLP